MRLIDADALMPNAEYKGKYDVVTAYDIANAPTVELERKKGEWIDKGHDNIYQCSACGDMWMGIGGYRYCPNCGADMRDEEDE